MTAGWRHYTRVQSVPWTVPGLPSAQLASGIPSFWPAAEDALRGTGAALAARFPQRGGLQRAIPQLSLILAELLVGACPLLLSN